MNIIATCQMGPGTLEAKFAPLSKVNSIENIFVLRKEEGVQIEKVKYIILPRICRIKWIYILVAPLFLLYYSKKHSVQLILSYHVIPHAFFAFLVSKISGIPFNISQTGLIVQKLSERKFVGRVILHVLKESQFINVPGTTSKEHWIKMGINPLKIKLLHSTIDTEIFSPTNTEKNYNYIFMGRLAPEKNIELILHALINLNEKGLSPSMVIVGDGPERKKLEDFVIKNKLGNQVSFVGFQTNVIPWLNKSEIFVMSSTTDAMPTALMQAMSCELICISSNVGNIPDLIVNEFNGFLFDSGNIEHLSKLMIETLKEKDNYSQLRQNARSIIIKNHSHRSVMGKWESQFIDMVN